jgi:hypothetical protein
MEGEYNSALEKLSSIIQQLARPITPQNQSQRGQLMGEKATLEVQVEWLRKQREIIDERVEKLTVRAPFAGRVMTWDVKRQLQNRPVDMGQILMTIAAADTDYVVDLYMPERRMGHVHQARDQLKSEDPDSDLGVEFVSMTDPGMQHTGRVIHVNPTAEPHEEQGNVVRIRVQPDKELKDARPGATVTANVHCGRAPWLWAKLHEAWEWLETSPVMF